MKMHYRKVGRDVSGALSITIPCGTPAAKVTRDTTKEKSKVTCLRCLKFLKANAIADSPNERK